VLYFDSNGTAAGESTLIANLGTATTNLGTADFVFTGSIATSPTATPTNSGSLADLTAAGNTFPTASNNFGSGAGGYNFSSPVLFTGDASANSVTGTEFADIFIGGGGADVLTGGAGADLFVYKATGEGGDTITDFTSGTDQFQFTASAFGNLTTTNFDSVSGSNPDITGKELVIFTGGSFASLEDAQAKVLGNSTSAGFFAFTNTSNETVLYFDSNGTAAGESTLIANLGTTSSNLGTADFVFTGSIASSDGGTPTDSGSVADLTAAGNTFPTASNNFGSGGYNFTSPVLFTGDGAENSVTGTEFADIFSGGSGADIFDGGLGNDTISGDDGNDSLFGGGGSDNLNGGPGNDTLIGGVGTNVLNGGSDLDVFVFSGTTAGGGDLITNYNVAEDVINLDKTGFAAFTTGGALDASFYAYSSTVSDVTVLEATLTGPSIMAIYDSLAITTKLYYDSNGSTVGGNSLFATVDVNLGSTGNSELFLF
jgi:Ca2+-binding RTX toxin-like protein